MKNKIIYILFSMLSVIFYNSLTAQTLTTSKWESSNSSSQISYSDALQYINSIRNNQITGEVNPLDHYNALREVENLKSNKTSLTWRNIGPVNQGGRTRSIIFDRNNPAVMYAGAVSGGLWKTTNSGLSWSAVNDLQENLAVTSIAQAPNGIIWYSTGEGFAVSTGTANGSTGFIGGGLFKSTDATGTTFEQVASTNPSSQSAFAYIFKVATHPNGGIYLATQNGVRFSNDEGSTWTNPLQGVTGGTSRSTDIEISTNGNIIVLVVGNRVFISHDAGATFNQATTGGATGLPAASAISRIEIAIAPSNENIMYAMAAKSNTEDLLNIYRSIDAGATWSIIGPGGSTGFDPIGAQGFYSNVVKVHPTNPNKIFVGGLNKWSWELNQNWEQLSTFGAGQFSSVFLPADHHDYVFHPQNPNIIYYATDGGIYRSTNGGTVFHALNRNYITSQYYTIAASITGELLGGTQDNGTLFLERTGFPEGNAISLGGMNGGGASFSSLNNKLIFLTTNFGALYRSPNKDNESLVEFYDSEITSLSPAPGASGFASFITPIAMHERIDDFLNPDSVTFTATEAYSAGQIITVASNTSGYPFQYQLTSPLAIDDTLRLQDPISSRFYVGATNRIFMTRESHDFSKTPDWHTIANVSGTVQSLTVSNCGNFLFAGTSNGNLFRISNLNLAYDSLSAAITSAVRVTEVQQLTLPVTNRAITSIAVDPKNPARVLVTLGNYGNNIFLYMSINALDANPTFTSRQGTLPRMPVYSAIIDLTSPNTAIIGTELGVFVSTNINTASPTWTEANSNGFARVPVYDLKQQTFMFPGHTNYGVIYAATHGRGVFESLSLVPVKEFDSNNLNNNSLNVFPNPTTDFINIELPKSVSKRVMNIYNVEGRLVMSFDINSTQNTHRIDVSSLALGLYKIELIDSDSKKQGKFVKIK